jgi:hypothetical protein
MMDSRYEAAIERMDAAGDRLSTSIFLLLTPIRYFTTLRCGLLWIIERPPSQV